MDLDVVCARGVSVCAWAWLSLVLRVCGWCVGHSASTWKESVHGRSGRAQKPSCAALNDLAISTARTARSTCGRKRRQ